MANLAKRLRYMRDARERIQGKMREQELIVYREFEDGDLLYDMAWLMEHYKDDYYKTEKDSADDGCIAEIIIAKNRHGSTDTVKMGWIGRYTKFRTIASNMEDPV